MPFFFYYFNQYFLEPSKDNEDGIITKVVYEEGECSTTCSSKTYFSLVNVLPNVGYDIQIEVLKNDLGKDDKMITEIKVDGNLIGDCYPSGGEGNECDFYDCSFHLISKHIFSPTGIVKFEMTYSEHSQICECDKQTWICTNVTNAGSQMVAAARITLNPIGKK